MDSAVIGGIEGGGSRSTVVLLNSKGQIISQKEGPGTNHFLLGMDECRKRIVNMTNEAKKDAGIPEDTPLTALGLSLSGCEVEESNQELVRGLLEYYPTLSERYAVGSDTEGPIAATSSNGGVVCISGTGSNTLLINPDGSKVQCGGWGYILGDEGSAWKIAFRAIKACFDELDGFEPSPYPIDTVWSIVKEHFKVDDIRGLLYHFYTNFNKSFIALMCKELSVCAREGDELSRFVFREAGEQLARSIAAVYPKASPVLKASEGGLHILCVGSVWMSWSLLKSGFERWLIEKTDIEELSLLKLTTIVAMGAAYMAIDKLHLDVPRNYSKNYDVFYHYKRGQTQNGLL